MERGAAFHSERRSGVMREHKHIAMIGRIIAPPALPLLIRPCAADGAEHVASDDPSADVFKPASGEVVVNSRSTILLSEQMFWNISESDCIAGLRIVHSLECSRGEKPFHESRAADSEGMIEALVRTGAVAIE